jgi:hypothetical protein
MEPLNFERQDFKLVKICVRCSHTLFLHYLGGILKWRHVANFL